MILLDRPYVSRFLLQTIDENRMQTVSTAAARSLGLIPGPHVLDEPAALEAARQAHSQNELKLYTNSENALGWIADHLAFTDLPAQIEVFKNKARFRKLTAHLFPDFFYREVQAAELSDLDPSELVRPFIVKPNVGFFSLGVHKINTVEDWNGAVASLEADMAPFTQLYPEQVLDSATFLIEQYIEGDEYAVDAYYDADGFPVVLNILKHEFSSAEDVGDRVYSTSRTIVREHLQRFTDFLTELGTLTGARNFPLHVELRITAEGKLFPIEVNPLRFGGWCTTADLTPHAYRFNPYVYFMEGRRPEWDRILSEPNDSIYSIIVLDNSTGLDPDRIRSFDYERLLAKFNKPLELRRVDHREFRIFGFLFVETAADQLGEIEEILHSDLREFVEL